VFYAVFSKKTKPI